MKILKKLSLLLAALIFVTGCANNNTENEEENKTIRIGLVGEKNEVWEDVKNRYEEKSGNKIEFVKFSDYNEPNEALKSGDLDLNSFQHKKFLSDYNKENNTDIVGIGDTLLAPMGIYSKKIESIEEIEKNDKVAIPDDSSNGARALFLLQSAGLIKVNGKVGDAITVDDIKENPKELEIIELSASQTARSLDDVKVSIINSGMAVDAGLVPTEDAIFLEDSDSNDSKIYINIIAARKEDQDNEIYKDLIENYYQTDETIKIIEETSKGSEIPSWK